MPAANVPIVIDRGEDFTAQIIWTDNAGDPHRIAAPIRMDIKAATMTILSLSTPEEDVPEGEIPEISYSADIGMIQIHIPREQTIGLPPGQYIYDLFVAVDDGDAYAGHQVQRILVGQVIVNKNVTEY